ncbi:MAG TPA: RidA family protein [Sandaracinaceae bacterium LLY-WYZ-13_1]|nr:RidA family protein [Sandaracinaceae bacterium LLY-WYZ-13_1]
MATIVNPDTLAPPRGYSNGLVLTGSRTLFVAGQIGWDADSTIVSEDFAAQFAKALDNVLDVLRDAGGGPEHVGRFTIFVTDKQTYLAAAKAVGVAYRERMGKHYPAMSLVEVADLLEEGALVEIEATAVLP